MTSLHRHQAPYQAIRLVRDPSQVRCPDPCQVQYQDQVQGQDQDQAQGQVRSQDPVWDPDQDL